MGNKSERTEVETRPVRRLFSKQEIILNQTRMVAVDSSLIGHIETDFESRAGKIC